MFFRVKRFAFALAVLAATVAQSSRVSAQSFIETEGALVSVNGSKGDGFDYGTRLRLRPIGKPPVKEWRVELECERTNMTPSHKYTYTSYSDKGAAKLVGDKFLMTFKKRGSITMLADDPMTLTVQDVSTMCAEGSATVSVDESN